MVEKAISITYSECVSVALLSGMQCAIAVLYFTCILPRSMTFFHIISQMERFLDKSYLNVKYVPLFSLLLLSKAFLIDH